MLDALYKYGSITIFYGIATEVLYLNFAVWKSGDNNKCFILHDT